jgi:hypothetical protein
VEFTVLRAGEQRKTPVTVTEDTSAGLVQALAIRTTPAEPAFRVGVEVSDANSTLRTQLKLPKDQGIVIDRVLPDSPAQKAGFQQHDLLLTVGGKPLTKTEDLSAAVKASEGKPLKFTLLRGGHKLGIDVTPEKRDENAYRLRTRLMATEALTRTARLANVRDQQEQLTRVVVRSTRKPTADAAAQLEQALKQIDELRDSLKALQGTLARPTQTAPAPAKTGSSGSGSSSSRGGSGSSGSSGAGSGGSSGSSGSGSSSSGSSGGGSSSSGRN